jgi:hypothetical protein
MPSKRTIEELSKDDILLLEQYKIQARYYMNETRLVWTRYTVHLAISSGLITVWAYLSSLTQSSLLRYGLVATAVLGIIVAFIWILAVSVSYDQISKIADRLSTIAKRLKMPDVEEDTVIIFADTFRKPRIETLTLFAPMVFVIVWIVLLLTAMAR